MGKGRGELNTYIHTQTYFRHLNHKQPHPFVQSCVFVCVHASMYLLHALLRRTPTEIALEKDSLGVDGVVFLCVCVCVCVYV